MKAKLLKKIRNQYRITKVSDLGTKPTYRDLYYESILGLPYFYITDGKYDLEDSKRIITFKTLQQAKDTILDFIREDYTELIKFKPVILEHVWPDKEPQSFSTILDAYKVRLKLRFNLLMKFLDTDRHHDPFKPRVSQK